MALPSYLANIKSSGMYRFVWDKSEIPNIEPNVPLRLVVGYSEKGPFNTPVYVRTQTEFRKIYGGVSKKLERYGCYFHRLALQALRRAPILCLNLKNFNEETLEAVSFDLSDYLQNSKGSTQVPNIYNTAKFWTLEPEILEDEITLTVDSETPSTISTNEHYITITATDSKESSNTIFVRGFEPIGYDVTIKEWYSSVLNGAEVPSYAEGFENNKLNRYWAEIYVFKGEFTPEIATSNVLAKYFDVTDGKVMLKPYIVNAFGEKKDALDMLAANDASNFIRKYQGILLPEFVGANGNPLSLDIVFNADNDLHKMMMRLNQTLLYDSEEFTLDDIDTTGVDLIFGDTPVTQAMSINGITPVAYVYTAGTDAWSSKCTYSDLDGMTSDFYAYKGITMTATEYSAVFSNALIKNMGLKVGDVLKFKAGASAEEGAKTLLTIVKIENTENEGELKITFDAPLTGLELYTEGDLQTILAKPTTPVEDSSEEEGEEEEYYEEEDDIEVTMRRTNPDPDPDPEEDEDEEDDEWDITDVLSGSGTCIVKVVGSVLATSINLIPTYVQGYEYEQKKPNGSTQEAKAAWADYQLSILNTRGLRSALTNRQSIAYRYVVDTFEGFAVAGECKAKLALLCKLRESAVGLLNFPAMKSFAKSSIMFKGDDGNLDTAYIAQGCNPMYNNGAEFKLASQDNGASYVSYNTALVIKDPETGVRTTIPSAGLVSNDFIDKYEKFLPYSIVAGPKRGSIDDPNLIGPDFNFGRDDLDNLEPMGVNCMVYVPGKGTYINSNQTAKQNPVTALSKLHIRELCIFLQDEIENMMEYYHWDFNTPNLRQTLKDRADVICETCKNNGGCYEYYNQCDSQNNTPEIIDNEMIILSTSIEPSRGAGKMIHELTLYRTGGLSIAIKDA